MRAMQLFKLSAVSLALLAFGPVESMQEWDGPPEGFMDQVAACNAAPTDACLLDILWTSTPRLDPNYRASTYAAFVSTAAASEDSSLLPLYQSRTGRTGSMEVKALKLHLDLASGDIATLQRLANDPSAIRSTDWYGLADLGVALAKAGDLVTAREVAARFPADPGMTARNQRERITTAIGIAERQAAVRDITPRDWATAFARLENFTPEQQQVLTQAEAVLRMLATDGAGGGDPYGGVMPEIMTTFKGGEYFRALIYLTPAFEAANPNYVADITAGFGGFANPNTAGVFNYVIRIAPRLSEPGRAQFLDALEAALTDPTPGQLIMIERARTPDVEVTYPERILFGQIGDSYDAQAAIRAWYDLGPDGVRAAIVAEDHPFTYSLQNKLSAIFDHLGDDMAALELAEWAADYAAGLPVQKTSRARDTASAVSTYAYRTCNIALFDIAAPVTDREDDYAMQTRRTRMTGDTAILWSMLAFDGSRSDFDGSLAAYREIMDLGWCNSAN